MVLRAFAACLIACTIQGDDQGLMPSWILPGILAVESRSAYVGGAIEWNDRRIGSHGELGPFQITYATFLSVRLPGEVFSRIGRSPAFGEIIAMRILFMHYRAAGSWALAVIRYHLGARGSQRASLRAEGQEYLERVRIAGFAFLEPLSTN